MNRLRYFMMAALSSLAMLAWADDYAYLCVDDNGTQTQFSVSSIKKITFDNGYMVMSLSDGKEQKLPLSGLTRMFFSTDGSDGIFAIADGQQEKMTVQQGKLRVKAPEGTFIAVYDMNGRCLQTVKATATVTNLPLDHLVKGTYIVKIGNTSQKIIQ